MEEFIADAFETDDKEVVIDEIMNKYGQEILQLVYSYINNKAIVEDLTQDIFIKCFKALFVDWCSCSLYGPAGYKYLYDPRILPSNYDVLV